jgi:hypothetical protein
MAAVIVATFKSTRKFFMVKVKVDVNRQVTDQVFSLRDENIQLKKKLSASDENARKYQNLI